MNLVCSGTRPWGGNAEQQLLLRLSSRGHRVLYVQHTDSPGGGRARGVQRLGAGALFGYTYSPPHNLPERLRGWHLRRTLRRLTRELYLPEPAVLDTGDVNPVAWRSVRPLGRAFYPVTESALARTAARGPGSPELMLAPTRAAFESLRRGPAELRLLERGADRDRFAPWRVARAQPDPRVTALPGPRIGYLGPQDDAVDRDVIAALARARPEWSLVLAAPVGTGEPSALPQLANLHHVVFAPDSVAALLAGLDVLIWPRATPEVWPADAAAGLVDCLATGLPVVCARAAVPPFSGAVAADTDEEWLVAVDGALREPTRGRQARLAYAQQNDWEARTDELERHLHELAATHRSPAGVRAVHGSAVARIPGVPEQFEDYGLGEAGPALGTWQGRLPFEVARAAGWVWYALRLAGRALSGRRPIRIRRILVVRNKTFLGDTIAMMPALEALREHFPDAHIVLGVQQGAAIIPLVNELRLVDEVVLLRWEEVATSRRGQLLEAWRFFRRGYDLVVSGVGYFLAQEAFYTGAPYRVGLYSGVPMQGLNNHLVPLDRTRHEVENNLDLIEVMTNRTETPRRTPRIGVDPATAAAAAEALWKELGIGPDEWVVTVHPGSKKPSRRWPTERFAALITRLLSEHPQLRAVVTGVPGEDHLAEEIVALVPEPLRRRSINAVGRTSMTSLIGLLDSSRVVVSNDTGVMHLARARGAALLALLGPENDRRWGPVPWGHAPSVALRHVVPCAPCARTTCDACYCLHSLSVDEAFDEAERLLRRDTSLDAANGGVQRRLRHHGWHDLLEAGFELPLVSVVLLDRSDATVKALERQDYPRIEVIDVAPAAGGSPQEPRTAGTALHEELYVEDMRSARVWHQVLATATGEFIAPLPAGADWPAGKISSDVATLVRNPDAGCSVAVDAADHDVLGAVAARRDALTRALEELAGSDAPLDAPFSRLMRVPAPASVRIDLPVLRTGGIPADPVLTAVR